MNSISSLVDEDDTVICKICGKGYAVQMALNNHVKMSHEDIYATGDPLNWSVSVERQMIKEEPVIQKKPENRIISQTANAIMSQMTVQSLTSLANGEVKYVIIKSDDIDQEQLKQLKKRVKTKPEKEMSVREIEREKSGGKKRPYTKKVREVKTIPGPFICMETEDSTGQVCCQSYLSCCEYSIHFRDDHKRRKKSNKCQVCEKLLLPNFVDDGSPFKCKECGLGFQIESEMKYHQQVAHAKIRPFKCGVCYKKFTQKAILLQHMRLHTGQKPFVCQHCSKSFTQKSTLCQHLRVHTKDKPYRCVVCNKNFTQYGILRQHMRTHTNIAPFQCHICQRTFKQNRPLSNHIMRYHPTGDEADDDQEYILEIPMEMDTESVMQPVKNEVIEVEMCDDDDEFVLLEPDVSILG